ncbi:caspase domain-containing protein [Mycena belliarum]|uniref:Caspase domain-containing protein n=1 Tax=Mycena belliarum TaxID=1033014 RepID=A0AAD6XJ63_9AGAR|nr:caspase domain-containing protein [Mycena belliae]
MITTARSALKSPPKTSECMRRSDLCSTLITLGLAQIAPIYSPRKNALLIGVEGSDESGLPGTHKAIKEFRALLTNNFGFPETSITTLLDDGDAEPPTKSNIMAQLMTFLDGQRIGDLFVFVYAGHTTQADCIDGSEADGLDEMIITCDGITILDDVLNEHLVKPLAPSSRLVAFLDTCHSETLLDLAHCKCNRLNHFRRFVRRLREIVGFPVAAIVTEADLENKTTPRFCSGYCPRTGRVASDTSSNVICISACKDSQMVHEAAGESMLDEIIRQLQRDPAPRLKMLMRALTKSAKSIHHRAKKEAERIRAQKERVRKKAKLGEHDDDSESNTEICVEVVEWAPQV